MKYKLGKKKLITNIDVWRSSKTIYSYDINGVCTDIYKSGGRIKFKILYDDKYIKYVDYYNRSSENSKRYDVTYIDNNIIFDGTHSRLNTIVFKILDTLIHRSNPEHPSYSTRYMYLSDFKTNEQDIVNSTNIKILNYGYVNNPVVYAI